MLVHKFLCNVNSTRALTGLCFLVTSHLSQIPDPWHSQAFTIAHIVIGLSLHIHFFYSSIRLKSSKCHTGLCLQNAEKLSVISQFITLNLSSSEDYNLIEYSTCGCCIVCIHSSSQQGICASFGLPNPKQSPCKTPNFLWNVNLKHIIPFVSSQ